MEIRRADDTDGVPGVVSVWNELTPGEPVSVEILRERRDVDVELTEAMGPAAYVVILITFTQEGNDAMRRVSEKLGYVEQPAWLTMRRDLP